MRPGTHPTLHGCLTHHLLLSTYIPTDIFLSAATKSIPSCDDPYALGVETFTIVQCKIRDNRLDVVHGQ